MQKLTLQANVRMQSTLLAEEEHKKELNERIARESFNESYSLQVNSESLET